MILTSIFSYPLKSGAPCALSEAEVEARGVVGDRRWMVVDEHGKFLTGRQFPQLTQIGIDSSSQGIWLSAPGMPSLLVPTPSASSDIDVIVWKSTVSASLANAAAHEWISSYLGANVRLTHMGQSVERQVDERYARRGDNVSFADGFPLMAISQASLDVLNSKLAKPVSMIRFRPNLVIDGGEPYCEDTWASVRIGDIEFEAAKPCTRCAFVNVDPTTGVKAVDGEPLKTLMSYRRTENGVVLGRHLIPRSLGRIRIGDAVTVSR